MELPDDTENIVYVSHKLVRQPKYKGKWKEKFLKFYLIDQSGREQLAATAEDTGDAHYIYTSSENFKNYGVVSCRNREELILWLEMVIKKSQMKAAGQKTPGENEHYNDFAGFQFVSHRLEKLILEDGRRCNRWYLVDSESNEHLAVVGKERCASDGHYDYKAEEPFASRYPLRCSNLQGVLRWVAHMITPQSGQHGNISVPTTRGTPLANNSAGNSLGEYTPSSKSPARSFALQSHCNPSKRRKLAPTAMNSQGTATAEEMLVSRPRWAATSTGMSPGQDQMDGSFSLSTGEAQPEWDTTQQVKMARARQPSLAGCVPGSSRMRDPSGPAPKERQADQEDMLIADALVDLQQEPHKNQDQHLQHPHSGGTEPVGQMVSTVDMEGSADLAVGQGMEGDGEMYTGNINQKLIFDPQLQCQWSMRARNAIVTKGKVLARMKAGIYVYDSEQQELVRLEDTAYNRMKARIKDSFGRVFPNLAVEQNITDPCHPAFKVTPTGTVSVGLFATDHLGPGTILGDYLYRAVMETYAENEHYVMMDPTGKRALQEMYSMDLAFTSSWEGDALVALGHPARNTLACMNDYRALPQSNNRPQRRMCTNQPCNCHSYSRRTPNVELLETIEITAQRTIIPHLLVLTKRRVSHGDEILWDFGADFWERYEALVRRVHYVESQSQELERMKHTVDVSQHQLTALQNYIYEREQVISKLQQVMAMHGINAEQALQLQIPYQAVVQDANGCMINMDGSEAAGVMTHASVPAQGIAAPSQLLPASLPPPGAVATNNIPPHPTDGTQQPHPDLQAVAYDGQMTPGLLPGQVAGMAVQGQPDQPDHKHLELMHNHMHQLPAGQLSIEQMQGAAVPLQPGQLPLTLEQMQAAGQVPEQLPPGAHVQYLPSQPLQVGMHLTPEQLQAAGHAQQLQLADSEQLQATDQQSGPGHVMKQEPTDAAVGAAQVRLTPEQMQLMASQMQQLSQGQLPTGDKDVAAKWASEGAAPAAGSGEHWDQSTAVVPTSLTGLQPQGSIPPGGEAQLHPDVAYTQQMHDMAAYGMQPGAVPQMTGLPMDPAAQLLTAQVQGGVVDAPQMLPRAGTVEAQAHMLASSKPLPWPVVQDAQIPTSTHQESAAQALPSEHIPDTAAQPCISGAHETYRVPAESGPLQPSVSHEGDVTVQQLRENLQGSQRAEGTSPMRFDTQPDVAPSTHGLEHSLHSLKSGQPLVGTQDTHLAARANGLPDSAGLGQDGTPALWQVQATG